MNRKSLVVATLLFGLAGGSAFAVGGPGPGPDGAPGPGDQAPRGMRQNMHEMHPGHGGVLGAAYRVDNLSADQRKQLDALRDKEREQFQANRGDRQALHEAIDNGSDAKTIRPLAEKEGRYVTEMIMQQVELRDQVYKILTDAQRTQLKSLQSQMGPRERGRDR